MEGGNDTVRVTTPMLPAVSKKMRSAHLIVVSSYGCQRSTSEEGEVSRRGRRRRNDNKRGEGNWKVVARRIVLFRYSIADLKSNLRRHTERTDDASNRVVWQGFVEF